MNNNRNDRWVRPEGNDPGQTPRRMPPRGQHRPNAPQRHQNARPSGNDPRKKKKTGSVIGARIILFLIVFVLLLAICVGVFFLFFYSTPDKADSDMKITYGKETVKVSEDTAYRDSKLYLSFSKIANYLALSRAGDADSAKFIFASDEDPAAGGGEEYVEFRRDSTQAFVSGTQIRLTSPAYFVGDEVYIPAEFVTTYMVGLSVEENAGKHTVTVSKDKLAETDTDGKHLDAQVTLLLKAAVPPENIDIGDASVDANDVTFTTDLSAYEEYMNPADNTPYLVLVNKTTTIGPEYKPEDLVNVVNTRNDGRATQQMVECAEKALEALYIEMKAAGHTEVSVTSAYRSYEYQDQLYSTYVANEMAAGITEEEAKAIVDTYSARPGTSEHQTGLCCDMHDLPSADQAFENKPAYAWLKDNAWKFGFIERFPKGKEDITGYSFEPWHYRFVGRKAAAQIYNKGITLEEFLEG